MRLPQLSELNKTQMSVVEIKGFTCLDYAEDGEMRDSLNISCDNYPSITPRKARTILRENIGNATEIHSIEGKLMWVSGTDFIVDGVVKGTVTEGKKSIASITKRVVIFPDKKVYDASKDEFKPIEVTAKSTGNVVFSSNKITVTTGIFGGFNDGDAIEITGCTVNTENNRTIVIRKVESDKKTLTFDDDTFSKTGTETAQITFARKCPDLDFICEYGNRIWGCSNKDNTIYGSKLGDPFNWNVFRGLTTDSYSVPVGTQGEFTGCFPYSSQLVFFKEHVIHKLYGAKPSAFQILTSYAEGVKKGSEDSIAIIGDTIFYYSLVGVQAYTGNLPERISDNFGSREFKKCVASTDGIKYYCCFTDEFDNHIYMTFDTKHNLWLKVSDEYIADFAMYDGHMCLLDSYNHRIISTGHGEIKDNEIEWMVEFAETNESTYRKKGYTKLYVDADGAEGSILKIFVRQRKEEYREIFSGRFTERKIIKIPIIMGGSDLVQMKLTGKGFVKIHSITREIIDKGEWNE